MKHGILFGATAIAFGVLVSLLSFVLLPFCSGHGDMIMRCQKTSSVDGIIGIVIAIFGIAYIAIPKAQKALSAAVIAGGIFTALVPAVIVGVCAAPHMHCHSISSPVLQITGIVIALVGIANSIYLLNRSITRQETLNESNHT